jgi:parallel beta-helix repeat protein
MMCNGNIWIAGIFYGSGSSGTINRVRASGQVDGTCGVGIWVENSGSSNESVAIKNSSVYNVDSAGIFAGSGAAPTLSVDVANDVVSASAAVAAIDADSVNGEVEGNTVSSATFGVFDLTPTVTVTSNTITATNYGIYLGSGGRASGNQVSGSNIDGILLGASGATLTNNRIVSSTTAGVELGCFSATVNGNFINDAPVGFDAAAGSIPSNNTLYNTATTITNGCAVVAAASRRSMLAAKAKLQEQWHTPATPYGTRTK